MPAKKSKSPAFQFYVQDFLHGTMTFSAEEIGAYILMLCRQWDKGFVAEKDLEEVTKLPRKKIEKVLTKFSKKNSRFMNKRMALVKKEKDEYSKKQARSGLQGAKKRWQVPLNQNGNPIKVPMAKNGSSSSSSIKEINKEKILKDQAFIEPLMINWRIDQPQLKVLVDDFELSLLASGKTHGKYSEYKSHFFNWGKMNYQKVLDMVDEYTAKMLKAL